MWSAELEREAESVSLDIRHGERSPLSKIDITRVSQLDAEMLDNELLALLKTQSQDIFKHLPQYQGVVARYQPEINAFLRGMLWFLALRVNKPSPGDELSNLRYRNESLFDASFKKGLMKLPNDAPTRVQRLLHGVATVLVPLGWERLRELSMINHWSALEEDDWRYQICILMGKLEKFWLVATLGNFLAFFYNGRYRSLVDRLLCIRAVYQKAEAHRAASFDFINQQLLYDGFSEMLMCLLPLVDWVKLRRVSMKWYKSALLFYGLHVYPRFTKLYKFFERVYRRYKKKRARHSNSSLENEADEGYSSDSSCALDDDEEYEFVDQVDDQPDTTSSLNPSCSFCHRERACVPFVTNCQHVYCYYCLKVSQLQQGPGDPVCALCDELITSSVRL
uniref:RING-type E3 ubiquitin transferase (cysteine targeting) n=1 Tax=Mucochytrium quahogii TaxID=96639 RepID=A0A7S2RVX5_9STRA|mmetsp:Transcript_14597/g.25650  ORF Transcript_14597/g.25650 Transcript_14597/m.25650 type:complete len:393 (+) Transcript_14597:136-1314(+)